MNALYVQQLTFGKSVLYRSHESKEVQSSPHQLPQTTVLLGLDR